MKQEWVYINGYEGLFKISNFGNGKALRAKIPMPNGYFLLKPARDLVPKKSKNGYMFFSISKNRKQTSYPIHRLVAIHFIPNPENKPQVNHKDGNKENNRVDNLEWCTAKENIDHAEQTGLRNNSGFRNAMYGKYGKDHPAYQHPNHLRGESSPMYGKKGKQHPTFGKRAIGQKNPISKLILDTDTGIFYDTIKDASAAKCINKNTLYSQLQGRYKNKTSFIVV